MQYQPEHSTTVLSTNSSFKDSSNDILNNHSEIEKIFVDVKGAVEKPGVYEMKAGDRVNDVIRIAGGFTVEADQSSVNLAQKVQDEMIIVVPFSLQVDTLHDQPVVQSNNNSGSGGKVRINYATQEEIETLPGIGPSKAQAIIQYREENGYFQKVEDLLQISGIGEKTLENMRDELQIP